MNISTAIPVNEANKWRLKTPGSEGWLRSPRPGGAKKKYFIVSCDAHLGPPPTLFRDRIDAEFKDRCPRMERDKDGVLWSIVEGVRPMRIIEAKLEGEDHYRARKGSNGGMEDATSNLDKRMADLDLDGVDAELVFPNQGAIMAFWTPDPRFSQAQFRIYNDWAAELTARHRRRMNVAACIATADVDDAVAEVQRVAKLGYRVVTLPCKPIFGPPDPSHINYNLPHFDPLWAAIQETDLTITFHVSTGMDPRGARGNGGAVVNYVVHSITPIAEPVANLCASGVFDRFPRLRFATIEAGCGWVPWLLRAMDEAYIKHHMWVRPKLAHGLPSDYYRAHGASEFAEDEVGMACVERFGLADNFLWGNDYPHHEGTFPHSAEAIERQMGALSEDNRAKILGLNAARMFRFDIPDSFRD